MTTIALNGAVPGGTSGAFHIRDELAQLLLGVHRVDPRIYVAVDRVASAMREGGAWTGKTKLRQVDLARRCGIEVRQYREVEKRLAELGLVEVVGGPGRGGRELVAQPLMCDRQVILTEIERLSLIQENGSPPPVSEIGTGAPGSEARKRRQTAAPIIKRDSQKTPPSGEARARGGGGRFKASNRQQARLERSRVKLRTALDAVDGLEPWVFSVLGRYLEARLEIVGSALSRAKVPETARGWKGVGHEVLEAGQVLAEKAVREVEMEQCQRLTGALSKVRDQEARARPNGRSRNGRDLEQARGIAALDSLGEKLVERGIR